MAKIDALFDTLIENGGSDLHLGPGYPPLGRLRGDLTPLRDGELSADDVQELMFEIVPPDLKERFVETRDLDFAYSHGEKGRFRANFFGKAGGYGAVFRLIPTRVLTLAELSCPEVLTRLSERRAGLILVTGPTGSGKSTTLAGMLDHINKTRACHILTIEDPIEFVHQPQRSQVTHREVGIHASTFAAAMVSAGRENPDVILVGELRTNETMKLALQLASFGILVFATVHTNGAPATIERIVNAFPADEQPQVRGMLAEGLVGIVAQQLVRSVDGKRAAVHEVLIGSAAVSAMIRDGKTTQLPTVMQSGQAQGMQTMDMALERLLIANKITPETALDHSSDKEGFGRVIARVRPDMAKNL